MCTRAGTVYNLNRDLDMNGMEELENNNNERAEEGEPVQAGIGGGDMNAPVSMADMIQMFIEDRRQREEKQAEERRKWEAEMKIREAAYAEERRQREEENKKQMQVLQALVQGVQMQGEAAKKRAEGEKDVRVAKLTEEDDIVAYLTMFERLMVAYEVKKERWAFKLAPNLVGKAQQAYAGLSATEASSYERLKEAILQRYDITEESYRQRFRATKKKSGESSRELVARLDDLASKWLKSCENPEDVRDRVVLEQFLGMQSEEVRVFIRERKPATSKEAGKLADDFQQARKEGKSEGDKKKQESGRSGDHTFRRCLKCGIPGHNTRECRKGQKDSARPRRDLKDVECFNCHRKGHYSSNCPHSAMFCTEKRVDYQGQVTVAKCPVVANAGVVKSGMVEGHAVGNILLDTGCSRTLVHRSFVPEERVLDAEAVAIRCAHGDTVLYPLAKISLEVEGRSIEVEAAISETLPMSVLLGTDVPELPELLQGDRSKKADSAFAVITRAAEKKQREEAEMHHRKEEICEVQPSAVDSSTDGSGASSGWMSELDDDLFSTGKTKIQQSRRQKRAERKKRMELETVIKEVEEEGKGNKKEDDKGEKEQEVSGGEKHDLDISSEELKVLQATDPTLCEVRSAVKMRESTAGIGFFYNNGLLFRRWIPPGRDQEDMAVEQLVLPKACRGTVMSVAHCIPLAGHLGKKKTTDRVLQRFYWPTVHRDIAEFCRTCDSCQKCSGRKGRRVPLIPLPIISQPFERIAMDIVGPLPRSRKGNRFVLVICDYATRYPEAVPMKFIDAESVADELVKFFSRVGVPREILTDQGTNFTSQLLVELYRMLHIQPIRTTPYHPQTDGLVERFNQTLKLMLRKTAVKEDQDWDVMLPYLLFAYREVPQASTGFSPFELLYGHRVRGPLDVLNETWQGSKKSQESVISHVLAIRSKLEKMKDIADANLENAQIQQRHWYDKNARVREFKPGDMVLLLLPTSTSKLMAQWQGPFRVIKKIGNVNYQIEMPHHRKKKGVYHTNLLKKWEAPSAQCFTAEEAEIEEDDFPDWKTATKSKPIMGKELTLTQRAEMQQIFKEFEDVLQSEPGRTSITAHKISTTATKPIRVPPYRIPYAYREAVAKELEEMEERNIIEPSRSEWSAPIVVVKKKDGNIRLCVDYRRLNEVTPMDAYPMPRVDELIDRLGKAAYITTLDLAKGYWQVPMSENDCEKTAFTTPKGLYQFKVMPFGLNGAPATFQRMMDGLLRGMDDYSASYIDDIAVYSRAWEEHLTHVRTVLTQLRKNHLTAKPAKCKFGMKECTYLGHVVGNGHVRPDPEKIRAVQDFPIPGSKKQVRSFLGLTGYYRKFIPNYATVATPLSDLTKKNLPERICWNKECDQAFSKLKSVLCDSPVLRSPDFTKQFLLQTDASNYGAGAVLSQIDDNGEERPIAYFSRKFLPREQRYSTIEQECLAIKLGIEAFKVYLVGKPFIVQTDHRSLKWLNRLKENNSRLTRWSLALQPYSFEVVHRPGCTNGNADALSRGPTDPVPSQKKGEGM